MTEIKRILRAAIDAIALAARTPSKRETSQVASMHLATQGIDMSTMRRD